MTECPPFMFARTCAPRLRSHAVLCAMFMSWCVVFPVVAHAADGGSAPVVEHVGASTAVSMMTSVSVSTPASTERGDLLIASVARSAIGVSMVPPGWRRVLVTTAAPDLRTTMFWRRAELDGVTTYSFTATTAAPTAAVIDVYRGAGAITSSLGQLGGDRAIPQPVMAAKNAGDMMHFAFSHTSATMQEYPWDVVAPSPTYLQLAFQSLASGNPSVSVLTGSYWNSVKGRANDDDPITLSAPATKTIGQVALIAPDAVPAVGTFASSIVNGMYVSGTLVVQGAALDTGSGVAGVKVSYSGAATGTLCGIASGARSWRCAWNTTSLAPGAYTLRLEVQDNAQNTPLVVTREVEVGPPRATLVKQPFQLLEGREHMVTADTSLFFNPSQAGSFRMFIMAQSPSSRVARVEFPAPPAGWTISKAVDTQAPYEAVYSWVPGAASPGAMEIVATTEAGGVTRFAYNVHADTTPPTMEAPAATLIPGSTTARVVVGFSSDTGAGIKLRQLQRRVAPVSRSVCSGTQGDWTTISTKVPVGTVTDPLPAGSGCAEYRMLLKDKLGNVGSVPASSPVKFGPESVLVDKEPPAATISALSATRADSVPLTGTAADDIAVASIAASYSGPSTGSVCSMATPPPNWACDWNTSTLADGTYTVSVEVADTSGKKTTVTAAAVVDREGPRASLIGVEKVSGGAFVFGNLQSGTVHYNPAATFSVKTRITAVNEGGSISTVTFPAPGSGWNPAAPTISSSADSSYEMTYTYTGSGGVPAEGERAIVVVDNTGRQFRLPLTFAADSTPPSGATLTYPNGWTKTPSATVTYTRGEDTQSGIDGAQLERATASMNATGTCGPFSAYTQLASGASSPYADTMLVAGSCYRYRLLVSDRVGNTAVVESPGAVLKVDTEAPQTDVRGLLPSIRSGQLLQLHGMATDMSGLQRVVGTFTGPASGTICNLQSLSTLGWSCPWTPTNLPDGDYTITIELTDNAGNRESAPITRSVRIDTVAPTGSINQVGLFDALSTSGTITGSAADNDMVSSISLSYSGPQNGTMCTSQPTPTGWGCYFDVSDLLEGSYTLTLVVIDRAQNRSLVPISRTVFIDKTAPTGGISQSPTGSLQGVVTLSGSSADVGTGVSKIELVHGNSAGSRVVCIVNVTSAVWSCPWDTTFVYPKGGGTLTLRVWDKAGNRETVSITRNVVLA